MPDGEYPTPVVGVISAVNDDNKDLNPKLAGDPNATVEGTQDYTVQSGDAWYVLTERFGVSLDDLLGVNDWTDSKKFPNPGDVILLPPGAKSVAAVAAGSAAPAGDAARHSRFRSGLRCDRGPRPDARRRG